MKHILQQLSVRRVALAMGLTALVAGSTFAVNQTQGGKADAKHTAADVQVDDNPVTRSTGALTSFAPVVKKVAPAVVKLEVTTKGKSMSVPDMFGFNDPFWRRFFGEQFGGRGGQNRQYNTPPQRGLGSGVIVTKDGYILTNNHVVDNADEVKVSMHDGNELTAKVGGRDPKSDIAVLKIEGKNLPIVSFAASDKVQVGDVVLAIGNPFGVGQTVTSGIVSATGRGNLGIEDYEDFIQTDAAINPGNSGGALVDVEGRLIGINTAIFSRSGGNMGIGFAIPSDLARTVMDSLIKYGHVTRGYLGVAIQDINPALAKQFKLKDSNGALVGEVVAKSPAEKAGVKDGDVVLEYNGKKVVDSRRLKLAVGETKPGTTVPVKVLRDGDTKTLNITVQELPGGDKLAQNGSSSTADNGTLNGVTVADLDAQARQEFRIPEKVKGVIVTEVQEDSAAAEAGLKPGDVILEINRHPVKNAEEAVRMTEETKEKVTLLRIWSNGGSRFVVVDESKASK